MTPARPARVLVIDDLFGRTLSEGRNPDRANLCGEYLLADVTGDEARYPGGQRIKNPTAEAVFCRGQRPSCAVPGDVIENDLPGALDVVRAGWTGTATPQCRWALVLLDLCFYTGRVTPESHRRAHGMPEGRPGDDSPSGYFGLRVLRAIRDEFPDLPVVILSSMSRREVSREMAVAGASAFLSRGEQDGRVALQEYLWRHGLIGDDEREIVATSSRMLLALRAARRSAMSRQHVLIRGERGTGKELAARYLHRQATPNGTGPLVTVDSGALSPNLYASELFGHVRGAFTGADRARRGRLVEAHQGDLFLDEIGNMPADVQVGLLRALESRMVTPLGGTDPEPVDVRVISATNEDIEARAFGSTRFRADLLDRLREGGTIYLPPLRERREDIPALVQRFVLEAEKTYGAVPRTIDAEAVQKLQAFDWPGNVRELRSYVFEAVRNHRDVEHLTDGHIALPAERLGVATAVQEGRSALEEGPPRALDDVLLSLASFDFEHVPTDVLMGKLPKIEAAYARATMQYLRAVLKALKRFSPDEPEGRIVPQPAVALMTGETGLSATRAYDLIIRLRNISADLQKEWDADPLLREAYERAVARRRRRRTPGGTEPKES